MQELQSLRELPHVATEVALGDLVGGRYQARRAIARGGMGVVFEAEHVLTGARVALKALTADGLRAGRAHERILREARVLGALRHPNVVQIHDAGVCDRHGPFIVLEMIEGRPLDGLLATRHKLPVAQAIAVLVQLCDALDDAHRRGVIHRDIKPSNVLISRTPLGDQVELIDFGIASEVDDLPSAPRESGPKLTREGEILGTVGYMAPEQMLGTPYDHRVDVYAAAALAYECLVGCAPFDGPPTTVIARVVSGQRPPLATELEPTVPPALAAVLARALSFDPRERQDSARDLAFACLDALGGALPELELLERTAGSRSIASDHRVARASRVDDATARRQFVRAPYVTPARIFAGEGVFDGRTEDISEGGALLLTSAEVPSDVTVKVRVSLPTSGRVVVLDATTRWVRTSHSLRAIGLRFVDPPADVLADIRQYTNIMARPNAQM